MIRETEFTARLIGTKGSCISSDLGTFKSRRGCASRSGDKAGSSVDKADVRRARRADSRGQYLTLVFSPIKVQDPRVPDKSRRPLSVLRDC